MSKTIVNYTFSGAQAFVDGEWRNLKKKGANAWELTADWSCCPAGVPLRLYWTTLDGSPYQGELFGGGSGDGFSFEHLPYTKVYVNGTAVGQAAYWPNMSGLTFTVPKVPVNAATQVRLEYALPPNLYVSPSTSLVLQQRIKLPGWSTLVIKKPAQGQSFNYGPQIPGGLTLDVDLLSGPAPAGIDIKWEMQHAGEWQPDAHWAQLGFLPFEAAWSDLPLSIDFVYFVQPHAAWFKGGSLRVSARPWGKKVWTDWRTFAIEWVPAQ